MPATKRPPAWVAEALPKAPVLRVTRYDRVASWLLALIVGCGLAVALLSMVWASNRLSRTEGTAEMELVELAGGADEGAVDETLRVDSPEEVIDDPSIKETPADEVQIEQTFENVIELADEAVQQLQQQYKTDALSAGEAGSATGTGRRALGQGPGVSGVPRDQRWFVRFSDRSTLSEYARQLDYFGIELGALLPGGRMAYLSNISAERPRVREAASGKNEDRLYMTWQGGARREADIQLFAKAGLNVRGAILFQFYPPETEAELARLEREYRNRPADAIRRTYFHVRRIGAAEYTFEVTRQSYFR